MKEFEFVAKVGEEPSDDAVRACAAKALECSAEDVGSWAFLRRSLDARGRSIVYRYRVAACRRGEMLGQYRLPAYRDVHQADQVLIIGAGPAGMFAALHLLQCGMKPVIIERGKDVHARKADLGSIAVKCELNPESNFCFGEGGAGTFSDGKLYTRSNKRGDIREVLCQLVSFGADSSIMLDAHPHIGSDRLPRIVENLRNCILSHGGEYHFGSKVTDLVFDGRCWNAVCADGKSFSAERVILATGHSARDIYSLLDSKGWALEAKGFALGVRVEHPQELINRIRYRGRMSSSLPPAEYSLVTQIDGRGVFSFCMCPGGILVPASTDNEGLVLNGMSNSRRNSRWANSGVVVSVNPGDVPEYDRYGVFSLLEFQKSAEAFAMSAVRSVSGKFSFAAPAQRMTDFVNGKVSSSLPRTSYAPGVYSLPLHNILPDAVAGRLRKAFKVFDRTHRGYFTEEALVLGVESRTSSPVRIPRNPETLEYVSAPGIYPCGEGAGYAGGIVSSAVDGIRAAEQIARIYGKGVLED